MHTHTCTHTHAHTRMFTNTHAHAHTRIHTHAHTHAYTHTHTHTHTLNKFYVNKIITASYIIDDNKTVSAGRLHHTFVDITYQRLALKRLPHKKCMGKL